MQISIRLARKSTTCNHRMATSTRVTSSKAETPPRSSSHLGKMYLARFRGAVTPLVNNLNIDPRSYLLINLWVRQSARCRQPMDGRQQKCDEYPQRYVPAPVMFNRINVIANPLDPYENIYTVVRGKKHFTLLPPVEGWCLKGVLPYAICNLFHLCPYRTDISACNIYESLVNFSVDADTFAERALCPLVISAGPRYAGRASTRSSPHPGYIASR